MDSSGNLLGGNMIWILFFLHLQGAASSGAMALGVAHGSPNEATLQPVVEGESTSKIQGGNISETQSLPLISLAFDRDPVILTKFCWKYLFIYLCAPFVVKRPTFNTSEQNTVTLKQGSVEQNYK